MVPAPTATVSISCAFHRPSNSTEMGRVHLRRPRRSSCLGLILSPPHPCLPGEARPSTDATGWYRCHQLRYRCLARSTGRQTRRKWDGLSFCQINYNFASPTGTAADQPIAVLVVAICKQLHKSLLALLWLLLQLPCRLGSPRVCARAFISSRPSSP